MSNCQQENLGELKTRDVSLNGTLKNNYINEKSVDYSHNGNVSIDEFRYNVKKMFSVFFEGTVVEDRRLLVSLPNGEIFSVYLEKIA